MTIANLSVEGFLNASQAPEIESRRLPGRKRRALVLNTESARHPFRASLPLHVTQAEPEVSAPNRNLWHLTIEDVRGFATTYFAVFAAVLVFIM